MPERATVLRGVTEIGFMGPDGNTVSAGLALDGVTLHFAGTYEGTFTDLRGRLDDVRQTIEVKLVNVDVRALRDALGLNRRWTPSRSVLRQRRRERRQRRRALRASVRRARASKRPPTKADAWGRRLFRVWLDGVEQDAVAYADARRGFVRRYVRNEDGRGYKLLPGRRGVLVETVRGVVRIEWGRGTETAGLNRG